MQTKGEDCLFLSKNPINMRRLFIILLLVLGASCQQDPFVELGGEDSFLRVALPDTFKYEWTKGDKLSVVSLNNGSVATVDTFVAQEDGRLSKFNGSYTGAPGAKIMVVYPAMENTGGQVYESTPLFRNKAGFYRVVKGTSYLLYAPAEGMTYVQQKNADASGLAPLSCMLAEGSAGILNSDAEIALESKTSMITIKLDADKLENNLKVQSVSLSVSQGAPFTSYRGSFSLTGNQSHWIAGESDGTFEISLGDFSVDSELVIYVPVIPNNGNLSLSGNSERVLTIKVNADNGKTYEASTTIPANSAEYSLMPGKEVNISAVLGDGKENDDSDKPAIGSVTKIMEKGPSSVYIDGNIMYVGSKGIIYSMDISDPFKPVQIGSVDFQGSVRQVSVCDGTMVVSARETGVWIFDVSNPREMSLVSRFDGIELATGIDMAGDCIFVGERQTGVEFVDARNLSKPQHIRVIKTPESQTVFYQDGYLYSGEWPGYINIFDAKDMNNLRLVKTINLQGFGDGLWVNGNRLYASTGHHHKNETPKTQDGDGHGVEIWDVTSPENPVFLSRVEFDIFYRSGADWWLVRPSGDGKTLYCGDVYNGMYIVDCSDERNPKIIHRWEPLSNTQDNKVNAVSSLALADGVVYVAVSGEGLYLIESPRANKSRRNRGQSPVNLGVRYHYETPSGSNFNVWQPEGRGAVKGAAVYGDALFVGAGDAGLYVVKKDAAGKPYTVRHVDIPFAGGVAVRGDRLYVARGHMGLGVYRIGNDLSLAQIALLKTELNPKSALDQFSYWVSVPNDKYVVNGCRRGGYQFLAVGGSSSNPTYTNKLQYSLNLNYNRYISEKASDENMLAYATRSGLVWINLKNTSSVPTPTVYDDLKNSLTEGATLYKNNQFLLTRDGTLCTIAPGTSNILQTSSVNDAFIGIPRWESGDDVIVCNFVKRTVSKVNTARFTSPTIYFTESTIGYPEPGLFWNGKCVVPCGYQGLLIEK